MTRAQAGVPAMALPAQMTIVEVCASASKPDRGFVKAIGEVFNQDNEPVIAMAGLGMYRPRARV